MQAENPNLINALSQMCAHTDFKYRDYSDGPIRESLALNHADLKSLYWIRNSALILLDELKGRQGGNKEAAVHSRPDCNSKT